MITEAGAVYGEWTILELRGKSALCRCSCGTEKAVSKYTLGKSSTSCGHALGRGTPIDVPSNMKRCTACKQVLPLDNFHKDRGSGKGVRPKCKSCVKAYDDSLAERRAERAREKYRQDPQAKIKKTSAYRRLHPEYGVLGTRLSVGGGSFVGDATPEALLDKLMNEFDNKCYICGVTFGEAQLHWDHYLPIAKGGDHSLDNLKPACKECNLRKNSQWPLTEDLMKKIADAVRAQRVPTGDMPSSVTGGSEVL